MKKISFALLMSIFSLSIFATDYETIALSAEKMDDPKHDTAFKMLLCASYYLSIEEEERLAESYRNSAVEIYKAQKYEFTQYMYDFGKTVYLVKLNQKELEEQKGQLSLDFHYGCKHL